MQVSQGYHLDLEVKRRISLEQQVSKLNDKVHHLEEQNDRLARRRMIDVEQLPQTEPQPYIYLPASEGLLIHVLPAGENIPQPMNASDTRQKVAHAAGVGMAAHSIQQRSVG